jgi:hypothetical protein
MKSVRSWIAIPVLGLTFGSAFHRPARRVESSAASFPDSFPDSFKEATFPVLLGLATLGVSTGHDQDFILKIGVEAGVLFLDRQNGYAVIFVPIQTPSDAQAIGLNHAEHVAYNRELDRLNLVRQQIENEMTGDETEDATVAPAIWAQYEDELSPEAFSAAKKVAFAAIA